MLLIPLLASGFILSLPAMTHQASWIFIALIAALGGLLMMHAWRFSSLRFTATGIELPGQAVLSWDRILKWEVSGDVGSSRLLYLDDGTMVTMGVVWAWSKAVIDAALREHVHSALSEHRRS